MSISANCVSLLVTWRHGHSELNADHRLIFILATKHPTDQLGPDSGWELRSKRLHIPPSVAGAN